MGTDLVEFRLDSLRSPDFDRIRRALEDFAGRSIFTVRPPSEGGRFRRQESERLILIRNLRGLNPAYVDVELRTLAANRSLLPKSVGDGIIVSWHDLTGTPGRSRLLSIAARAARYGGVVKIVTTAKAAGDNLAVLSLYDQPGPPPIAFCMGSLGVLSRVISMEKGCPIAYGSLPGEPIAPGQPSTVQLLAVRRVLEHG